MAMIAGGNLVAISFTNGGIALFLPNKANGTTRVINVQIVATAIIAMAWYVSTIQLTSKLALYIFLFKSTAVLHCYHECRDE